MTDNKKPAAPDSAAGEPSDLPEDSDSGLPRGRGVRASGPRDRAQMSDELHAVARGGGVTGSWMNRRREKIVAEIERNRRGEYKVPTWVLASILVAVLAAWAAVIVMS